MMKTTLATGIFSVLLSAAPLIAGTIGPLSTSAPPVQMGPLVKTVKNWAGYVAETDFSNPQGVVTAVSGSWIVPTVTPSVWPAANASGQESDCVAWVGIDGWFGSNTVEQVGTESYIDANGAHYDVWYEMFPDGMNTIYKFSVSAGDSVTASVQYGLPDHPPGTFFLSIEDNTNGQKFSVDAKPLGRLTASRTSAEWIVEAPTAGTIVPLPTFGSVTFTDAQATIGSTTGAIDDPAWNVTQVNMLYPTPDVINPPNWLNSATTSDLTTVGSGSSASSSFTVVQTPEPSTLITLASAAAVLVLRRWARRKRR